MPLNPNELKTQYDAHIAASNPHEVTNAQIWGLDKVENVADINKPVSTALSEALSRKMDISDIYNSTEESQSIDLSQVPWSAAQGYSMNNTIDAWKAQDTSALEARIKWCEDNV